MPTVELNGKKYQGKVYQSASGGITPAILADAIKTVWAPCFVGRSADKVVGVLCDAYGHHWDVEVLKAMKDDFFCARGSGRSPTCTTTACSRSSGCRRRAS